jgi:hypothetical protein
LTRDVAKASLRLGPAGEVHDRVQVTIKETAFFQSEADPLGEEPAKQERGGDTQGLAQGPGLGKWGWRVFVAHGSDRSRR